MLRDTINDALKTAMKAKDARRVSTLRLVQAALKDRDIANRGVGKPETTDDELLQILAKMVKQREESAKVYEDAGRPELATHEREEIAIIADFQPVQFSDAQVKEVVASAIAEAQATGPKDMGKVMAILKERYAGQMDFAKASGVLKGLLSGA
ncbi:glutamyl-tRNA amidotransferase [Rhizobium sp. Leaf384]|uniref:GatB/YqeY domain-containing protein n=1 Tax=unclassified Rhizobium TaxID=2613769 RepID=UPI000713ED5A|nr:MULTISPECIES: GatB/YqeY domain-containing protein [unclassified Rhizobium]KQR69072.1 glutamyl-tRNA amidotransferase [Rhizobium sp. Leaf341]KQS76853.1 glutamyl-tRNA amidotransferase [Rhizobium sp. Leaf384]KQS78124.1 glutamyl-tRNA amidotransferase [Rhizobium sp. Leaf383]